MKFQTLGDFIATESNGVDAINFKVKDTTSEETWIDAYFGGSDNRKVTHENRKLTLPPWTVVIAHNEGDTNINLLIDKERYMAHSKSRIKL